MLSVYYILIVNPLLFLIFLGFGYECDSPSLKRYL